VVIVPGEHGSRTRGIPDKSTKYGTMELGGEPSLRGTGISKKNSKRKTYGKEEARSRSSPSRSQNNWIDAIEATVQCNCSVDLGCATCDDQDGRGKLSAEENNVVGCQGRKGGGHVKRIARCDWRLRFRQFGWLVGPSLRSDFHQRISGRRNGFVSVFDGKSLSAAWKRENRA